MSAKDVAGLIFGTMAVLVGAVLITDFRGYASAHVRRSVRSAEPLLRIPPWRWLPAISDARTFSFGMLVERLVGAMAVIVGLTVAVSSVRHLAASIASFMGKSSGDATDATLLAAAAGFGLGFLLTALRRDDSHK